MASRGALAPVDIQGLLAAKRQGLLPTGDMRNYQPTLRDMLAEAASKAGRSMGLGDVIAQRMRDEAAIGADFMPGIGDAVGVDETRRAYNAGNYGQAALSGVSTGLGAIPVGGDLLAGGLKAIVPVAAARGLGTMRKLPDTAEFTRAIANTPGAKIDPDGVVLPVTRNQRPEQSGADSVRGGVFYLPEGSKDARFYSGKNHNFAYGGTENIKGETLLSNPLFVKGATGGKAPEAAFDQLSGKGAYQKMRNEAVQVFPYYMKDRNLQAESVSKFLEKYAPEMVGMEYEIIANSSKGNQLAYALQEAAVASAVRRAGHDGVLGFSTSRKTKEPFISEVFDVRERTYPTPDGEFNVWDDYEGDKK
jgi:hypothetical protein